MFSFRGRVSTEVGVQHKTCSLQVFVDSLTIDAKNLLRNLVTDLKWSPDGKFILQTSEDKEVKVFDARDLSGEKKTTITEI